MSKNKNKQTETTMVEKERNEEIVTILNEANDDQVVNIDTSALDKELKDAEGGAGLVMPIRGGYSDKSNKKDKKDDKKNEKQIEKSSGLKSMFSMFLKGEAEAEEVSCKSVNEIKEMLEDEDLITLGKFIKKHPEILDSYLKAINTKMVNDSHEILDVKIEVEDVPEYKEENKMGKFVKVKLDKKKRKALRGMLAEFMDALDDRLSVKDLFDFIEKELGVDVIKIVNTFVDKLDSYDVDEFNKFIKKTMNDIQDSELVELIEYLTGQDVITIVNFLFENEENAYDNIKEMIEPRIEEIYLDEEMEGILNIESEDDEEMLLEFVKTFVKVAKKNMRKASLIEDGGAKKEERPDPLVISFNNIFFGGKKPKVRKDNDNNDGLVKIGPDDLMRKAMALMAK